MSTSTIFISLFLCVIFFTIIFNTKSNRLYLFVYVCSASDAERDSLRTCVPVRFIRFYNYLSFVTLKIMIGVCKCEQSHTVAIGFVSSYKSNSTKNNNRNTCISLLSSFQNVFRFQFQRFSNRKSKNTLFFCLFMGC